MAEGVGPIGTLIKGAAGLEAGKYSREVANYQADEEIRVGNADELRVRDAARMQEGMQVAGQAESGFATGTGSSLRSLEESAMNAELDRLNIRRTAAGRASGLRIQGRLAKQEGDRTMWASIMKAGQDTAMMVASGGASGGSSGGGVVVTGYGKDNAARAMEFSKGNYGG